MIERKQSQDRAPRILVVWFWCSLGVELVRSMSVLGESLGKSKQIAWIGLQPQIWGMIESKQCEDKLDLVFYLIRFHSWCAVPEDERLKKNWMDNPKQLKSFTLCIRSISSFNDQRNYVTSSKYLDKILNYLYLLMCQSKSVQSTTFETTFEEEKCVFHVQLPLKN